LYTEAEAAFSRAESREDFLEVAAIYQQLLDEGLQSWAIHFNQGLAYLEADETARAIAAMRRAQQLQPREQAITAALRQAGAAAQPVATDWYWETVQTLQRFFSLREKCWAFTTLLIAIAVAGMWCARYKTWKACIWMTALGAIPIVVLSISIAWDAHAIRHPGHGVVLNGSIGRRGPATLHAAVWPNEVAAGTEIVVREQQRNWVHVVWPGHGDAWLPTKDIVLY
jgi:hypothetical protein